MMPANSTMRDAFWNFIYDEMSSDESIFILTADFGAPALDRVAEDFPERFLSVGIAEQNLINIAAGLALEGRRVFAYAIAPFFVRCAEQIRINLIMNSQFRPMNVTLVGVGVGFSYVVSGPSHHALEDLAILHCFPKMEIITPSDIHAARAAGMLSRNNGIRYFRFDSQVLPNIYPADMSFPAAGYTILKNPPAAQYAIVGSGAMTHTALTLSERFPDVKVIDLLRLTPAVADALSNCRMVFSLEEGIVDRGGMGSWLRSLLPGIPVKSFGVRETYDFNAKNRIELWRGCGLSQEQLAASIQEELSK